MGPNPLIGVLYHWIGGLASASNFIPFKGIRKWAWEVYWLIQGVFSWIIAPSFMAWLLVPDVFAILHATSPHVLGMTWFWGVLWGFGGLTFGLTIRYLGIALGYAIALGLCTVFGTLMPPLFSGQLAQIASEHSGQVILFGLFVCVVGIVINAAAGVRKQGELSDEKKKETVLEFSFTKGLLVAVFSGIMSSCFAYGLASGKPIAAVTRAHLVQNGRLDLWQGLPVLIVVTLGGFTTNLIWCAFLILKNKRLGEYIGRMPALSMPARSLGAAAAPVPPATLISDAQTDEAQTDEAQIEDVDIQRAHSADTRVPLFGNYFYAGFAGVIWYFQFFFYSMGQTKMGKYDFSSWTLHMASIIIFSTLWGISFKEWHGTSRGTKVLVGLGLLMLVLSTIIIGYGNYLKAGTAS